MTAAERLRRAGADLTRPDRLAALATAAAFAACALQAFLKSARLTGLPADGPFQTYNPLRRMAAGELPGRDFPVFHGIGIYWALYPLFRLAGGTLHASELARHLLPLMAVFIVLRFVFCELRAGPVASSLLAAAAILLTLGQSEHGLFETFGIDRVNAPDLLVWLARGFQLPQILEAGNSLFGLRVSLPLATGCIFSTLAGRREGDRSTRPAWFAGALAGLCVWWSYEQGLAAGAALLLWLLCWPPSPTGAARRALDALRFLLATAASTWALYFVSTAGHPLAALRYALIEIPRAQGWYFAAAPAGYLYDWKQLRSPYVQTLVRALAGGALAFAIVQALRLAGRLERRVHGLASYLLLYTWGAAAAANLGLFGGYFAALRLVLYALGACGLLRLAGSVRTDHLRALAVRLRAPLAARLLALAALGVVLGHETLVALRLALESRLDGRENRNAYVPVLDTVLNGTYVSLPAMAARIDAASSRGVGATYAGPLEVMAGARRAAHTDYVIHALGEARQERWAEEIAEANPEFIHLIRTDYFPFEQWLQYNHWSFYRRVLDAYAPEIIGTYSVLWRRAAAAAAVPAAECGEEPGPGRAPRVRDAEPGPARRLRMLERPPGPVELWEATVHFHMRNPWRGFPLIGGLPHAVIVPVNSLNLYEVTLSPERESRTLPVLAAPGEHPSLSPQLRSLLPGAEFRLDSIRWCRVPAPPERLAAMFRPDDPQLDALRFPRPRMPVVVSRSRPPPAATAPPGSSGSAPGGRR